MLGPLPAKYRLVVTVCALVAFVGLGAWAGLAVPALFPPAGAAVGAALGVAAVALLLHDFSDPTQPRPVRARHRGPRP